MNYRTFSDEALVAAYLHLLYAIEERMEASMEFRIRFLYTQLCHLSDDPLLEPPASSWPVIREGIEGGS
jgi:hypothetical protein